MRNKFLNEIRTFNNINPSFITTIALRDKLCEKGIPKEISTSISSNMTIEVNENFIKDKELFNETLEIFSSLIFKVYKAAKKEEMYDYLINNARQMSLTYTY